MGRSNTTAGESAFEADNQIAQLDGEILRNTLFRREKYYVTLKSTKQPVYQQLNESHLNPVKVLSTIKEAISKMWSSLKIWKFKDTESEVVPTQSYQKKCENRKRRFNVTTPSLYENHNQSPIKKYLESESKADSTVNNNVGNQRNANLSWEHPTTRNNHHNITIFQRSSDQDCESNKTIELPNVSETDEYFSCNSFTSETSNTILPIWGNYEPLSDDSEVEFGKSGSLDSATVDKNINDPFCDISLTSSDDSTIFLNESFGLSEHDHPPNPLELSNDSIFGDISQVVIEKTVGIYIQPSVATLKILKDTKKDAQVTVKKEYKALEKSFDFEALAQKEMEDKMRKELEE
uniref:HMG box domain-containing protein n=1 Tax=Rhabditophanes sp. KR3021 TaxID=114890 RepID=A0AC35UI55_9BILA